MLGAGMRPPLGPRSVSRTMPSFLAEPNPLLSQLAPGLRSPAWEHLPFSEPYSASRFGRDQQTYLFSLPPRPLVGTEGPFRGRPWLT